MVEPCFFFASTEFNDCRNLNWFIFVKSLGTCSLVSSFARHNSKRNRIWIFVSSYLWPGLHWSLWQMELVLRVCVYSFFFFFLSAYLWRCLWFSENFILFYCISESYYKVRLPPAEQRIKNGAYKTQVRRYPRAHPTRNPRKAQSQYLAPIRSVSGTSRTTGPVFTLVKTDPRANFRWGVRHFVGRKYA